MAESLPLVYDITHFDQEGHELGNVKANHVLSVDVEREVQFQAMAEAAGATEYTVRLMRPHEVKALLKADQRARQAEELVGMFNKVFKMDQMMGFIAYLDLDRARPRDALKSARG